jgi:hypothetical protein
MDSWIAAGIFLLGAGAGALATAALHANQSRKLKQLLEAAAHDNPETTRTSPKSDRRKSALPRGFRPCSAVEVEKIARTIPEYVTVHPRASVLLLVDFTGASFNDEALPTMKESAVFNKPFIKKSALVGAETFPAAFKQKLRTFSGREFPTFKSREEALTWLVEDGSERA